MAMQSAHMKWAQLQLHAMIILIVIIMGRDYYT